MFTVPSQGYNKIYGSVDLDFTLINITYNISHRFNLLEVGALISLKMGASICLVILQIRTAKFCKENDNNLFT